MSAEDQKRAAGEAAAALVQPGMTVGLGTGSTAAWFVKGLAARGLSGIRGVPTSEATADLARSIAGMGINTSGVRQIAEAVGSGDNLRIARTVTTLRRVALLLGAIGAVLLVALSYPISWLSFKNSEHVGAIALLALAALFYDVSAGQGAVVQGMRRVGDLARISILGGIYGTVFGIGIVYYFYQRGEPERGVVPSMVCVAVMAILTSWWYSRRIKVERVSMSLKEMSTEVSGLLNLGFIFMLATLMSLAVAYFVRVIVLRYEGDAAAGYYQAAWALGGMYVGFILQAMGTDFYPRLTAVANDNKECNRLVNEQAEIGLLIAGPGVLGTLTFAPLVIQVLYSSKFGPAVEVLRWICLGMIMRVASWPMGFILGAKGIRRTIFWSELIGNGSQIGFAWLGVHYFGLNGAGMGFFASYVLYWFLVYFIVRSVSGFRWSAANKKIGLLYGSLITVVFVGKYVLPPYAAAGLGIVFTIIGSVCAIKILLALVPLERLPRPARKLFALLKLTPPSAGPAPQ